MWPDSHALTCAQMVNGAMLTARQTAQEEILALSRRSNPNAITAPYEGPSTGSQKARTKLTARKITSGARPAAARTGSSSLAAGYPAAPMPRAKRIKQTARKSTPASTNNLSASPPAQAANASNEPYIWELYHETGFVPDGFHSYMEPTKRDLGTFTSRVAAVRKGQHAVGSDVGYSWQEVQESGDIETVADSATVWEICWSPPDSQYSCVIARRIAAAAGQWVVDVEQGYPADGFHSYQEPTKKRLGPYATRSLAVQIGKRQVGAVYGIKWDEVIEGGDLNVKEDSSHKWEVVWCPPDSEYAHVIVRMLPSAQTGELADDIGEAGMQHRGSDDRDQGDSDDDEDAMCFVF